MGCAFRGGGIAGCIGDTEAVDFFVSDTFEDKVAAGVTVFLEAASVTGFSRTPLADFLTTFRTTFRITFLRGGGAETGAGTGFLPPPTAAA
jgi:hypothetical protein